jgi:adenylate cyclase
MSDRLKKLLAILDGLTGLGFMAWIYMPIAMRPLDQVGMPPLRAYQLPGYLLQQAGSAPSFERYSSFVAFAAFIVPAYGLLRLLGVFLGKRMRALSDPASITTCLLRILATSVMVYCFILPFLRFGDRFAYYPTIPIVAYAFCGAAIAFNIASAIVLLRQTNLKNPVYREYKNFKKMGEGLGAKSVDAKRRASLGIIEILLRIRAKLFFAFIGVISVTLVVLITILLSNYRSTILNAVSDGAKTQVEQAASVYKVNLGNSDSLAMFEYMSRLSALNERAQFQFTSFAIYSSRKTEVFADELAEKKPIPDFQLEYSSQAADVQYPQLPALTGAEATGFGAQKSSDTQYDKPSGIFTFFAPITLPVSSAKDGRGERRARVLGYVVETFQEDEIFEPYFRSRSSVIALTIVFGYLSILLVYVVGNFIVNPLLFLSMSVRKISESLRSMIRGESRVSATNLQYVDYVSSRDEIKALSGEIGNMVTVIRGIIPYISSSTLRQAEKGEAASAEKEMAFLFTDIRGFTAICEGMKPDQVVGLLNHYLDIETEIILANGGDVDKFVGDEMMAAFDGKDKELRACKAAMEIRHAMLSENEQRRQKGLPTIEIGIGVNSGTVVFGSVGARDRMDFTSIGDTVNLAARLEGANKIYATKAIIPYAVWRQVKSTFLCRELDYIAVKGKNEPVRIYEILVEKEKATTKHVEIAKTFQAGLAAYRERDWKTAAEYFKKNIKECDDGPSEAFLQRIKLFMKTPPPDDWDGIFRPLAK